MKKHYTILLIVIFMLPSGVLSFAADLKDGFLTYKWGRDISQFEGLSRMYEKNDITYYSNPAESYIVDDVIINNVIFGFYREKLFGVYIGIDSLDMFDKIKQHMRTKYGFPSTKVSDKDSLTTYKWKHQDITIKLKADEVGGKMKLAFYFEPLSRDLKKETLDDFSETSYKFFPIDKNKKPEMIPFLEF